MTTTTDAVTRVTARVAHILTAAGKVGLDVDTCSVQVNSIGVELHAYRNQKSADLTDALNVLTTLDTTPADIHYLMTHKDGTHAWITRGTVPFPDGDGQLTVYTNGPCPDQR